MENGILNIQAYTSGKKEEIKKNYVRKEFLTSSLARSFRLPEGIDVSNIKAHYRNGRLYIKMGKANTVKQMNKKVKVQ
ncbi:Hsp20/alpha crystallin family protein [Chryseobacterium cucumeris]|uniref:Hsp20/alpha crystallin family protein n=1 Tax=Chryseobacterium cucumeris TaxID=1813611 RepID=UPI0032096AE3